MAPQLQQNGLVEAAGGAEQGRGAQTVGPWPGADNCWTGRDILGLGAGDDVMRTGSADITKNLSGSFD